MCISGICESSEKWCEWKFKGKKKNSWLKTFKEITQWEEEINSLSVCVCVCVCVWVAQSCLTLCDPTDCSPPGFSVHGILQAQILEWVAVPSSRGSSQPRDRTRVLKSCSFTIITIQLHVVCGCVCQTHTWIFYVKIVFFSFLGQYYTHTHTNVH